MAAFPWLRILLRAPESNGMVLAMRPRRLRATVVSADFAPYDDPDGDRSDCGPGFGRNRFTRNF
jgi:hypothetical protein